MKNYLHIADCVKSDESVQSIQKLVMNNSVFDPEEEEANEEGPAGYIAGLPIMEGFKTAFEGAVPGCHIIITFLREKNPGKIYYASFQ